MSWYLDGVREFADRAQSVCQPRNAWRTTPLLALPLIGTGAGGQKKKAGEMERELLTLLRGEAKSRKVDFVLVLKDESQYASAQAVRRSYKTWPLTNDQRAFLDALAKRASRKELVLFVGAGLSQAAGLPSWTDLLLGLADAAQFNDREALKAMSALDAAAILEKRLGAKDFRAEVARLTTSPCFGLGRALTAPMPIDERVTTNYDECIEDSLEAIDRKPSVLPYHPAKHGSGWLLKMHGTIGASQDIVLTRQDFMRYENRRGALFGIVQAQLLTRHILFLGFSLRDDNFHSLVDEVRCALEDVQPNAHDRGDRFGSVFVPPSGKLGAEFWESELAVKQLGTNASYGRKLEIALDYLGYATSSSRTHLLDERYRAILTDEEVELKQIALELQSRLTARQVASATFQPLVQLLQSFGSRIAPTQNVDEGVGEVQK